MQHRLSWERRTPVGRGLRHPPCRCVFQEQGGNDGRRPLDRQAGDIQAPCLFVAPKPASVKAMSSRGVQGGSGATSTPKSDGGWWGTGMLWTAAVPPVVLVLVLRVQRRVNAGPRVELLLPGSFLPAFGVALEYEHLVDEGPARLWRKEKERALAGHVRPAPPSQREGHSRGLSK